MLQIVRHVHEVCCARIDVCRRIYSLIQREVRRMMAMTQRIKNQSLEPFKL